MRLFAEIEGAINEKPQDEFEGAQNQRDLEGHPRFKALLGKNLLKLAVDTGVELGKNRF